MPVRFIPYQFVLEIHADLIQRYGGEPGLRDRGLLESALAQPKITVGGRSAHVTLFEKAAAYGFHVCQNHLFVDGNKRTAFVLMDIFLRRNGREIDATEQEVYTLMLAVASGSVSKPQLAYWLKEHTSRPTAR